MEVVSTWRSPSNIALVKYWGKHGLQMPNNASLSLTLTNAFTESTLKGTTKKSGDEKIELCFLFEGKPQPKFSEKIVQLFGSFQTYFPFIGEFAWHLETRNSFPHSTGIASSASSMSALALCLCSIEQQLAGGNNHNNFFQKASLIARLGSGSACRSVYPGITLWGQHPAIEGSSNEYAVPVNDKVSPVFSNMKDAILIVSRAEKSVSSRAGHALMDKNPYAEIRYYQANQHIEQLINALMDGDISTFGSIVEKEALTLHALMMMSEPSFLLMQPNTLQIIEKVRNWRADTGIQLYFTLDAGPNVHLLYPCDAANKVEAFIRQELLIYCEGAQWISDEMGAGPTRIY